MEPSLQTVLSLDAIPASGRHGANPGEQLEAQAFTVDVEVWVDVAGDSLDATLDYRSIVQQVRTVVETESYVLLEVLAEAIARALYQLGPVTRATAVVHKPGAADSLGVDDVYAEVTVEE